MPAMSPLNPDTISVQLYTVREAVTDDDLDQTLVRIAGIGYRQVEPFGFPKWAEALAGGLERYGLAAPTTHASIVDADLDAMLPLARRLGIGTIIDPHTDPARWSSVDGIAGIADALNAAARKAADHGVDVGYHNHAFELESDIDGKHGLEILADQLSPEVILEVDTYWANAGGADVPALLNRLGDRVQALHIKDGDGSKDPKNQVAVGSGSLPVWDFVHAAHGMRYGVVELDDSAGDRFTAIADSFDYLTGRTPGPAAAFDAGTKG